MNQSTMPGHKIAKQICSAVRLASISEIQVELQNAHVKFSDPDDWRTFVTELWCELSYHGYVSAVYVGRENTLVIGRLMSDAVLLFDFAKIVAIKTAPTVKRSVPAVAGMEIVSGASTIVAPHAVLDQWRALSDIHLRLLEECSLQLSDSEGRMSRRLGDLGLDKYRFTTAFMLAVQNGFLGGNGKTVNNGIHAIEALVDELNAFNQLNECLYTVRVEKTKAAGAYLLHFAVNEENTYSFKMNLGLALGTVSSVDAPVLKVPTAAVPSLPAAGARGPRAKDLLEQNRNQLPDFNLANSPAVRAAREERYADEQVAEGLSFSHLKDLLHSEEGRIEAKRLIAVSLDMSVDSTLREMLDEARKKVADGEVSAVVIAILLALI